MASNKVIINSEANSVVISEPVEGNRIVKVIAAGPQGARGEGFNTISASLNDRIDVLEAFSGSYTGLFSGSFFGDASGLINIPAAGVVGLQLNQIASGDVTASISSGATSFRIFDSGSEVDYLSLDNNGKLWVTGSVSASLVFGQIVSGSELIFTKLSTSQSSASQLIIGNSYGDYLYKQTTIFKNSDVIVSGSLVLEAKSGSIAVAGGLYYSLENEFYLGFN